MTNPATMMNGDERRIHLPKDPSPPPFVFPLMHSGAPFRFVVSDCLIIIERVSTDQPSSFKGTGPDWTLDLAEA